MNIPDRTEESTTGNYRLSRRGRDSILQREKVLTHYYNYPAGKIIYQSVWDDVPFAEEEE